LSEPEVRVRELGIRGDSGAELTRRAGKVPRPHGALARRVRPQRPEGSGLLGPCSPCGAGVGAEQRVRQRVEGRSHPALVRRYARRGFTQRGAAACRVVQTGRQAQRIPEAPQLPHDESPGTELSRDGEPRVERDAEWHARPPPRQGVVDPCLVREPDLGPAGERFGEQLGAARAVERRRLTAFPMREGQDEVARRVE
jgi:hypothetical protein